MASTIALFAQNQRLKRVKAKTRVVGRGDEKIALNSALCANLQKACETLKKVVYRRGANKE